MNNDESIPLEDAQPIQMWTTKRPTIIYQGEKDGTSTAYIREDLIDREEAEKARNRAQAIDTLIDETGAKILEIARSDKSTDSKMREICELDNRAAGWKSAMWAKLLGVSDAAIRKTQFWKIGRRKYL